MMDSNNFFDPNEVERQPDSQWTGPDMAFHLNLQNKLCLCLRGWDTPESVDGFTIEEIDILMEMLKEAKTIIERDQDKAVEEMKQGQFNWEQNNDA